MRYITGVVGIATVVAAMLAATSSFASYPSSFGPAPFPSTFERESSLLAKELAVLTDQGIAPARASESLRLQGEVVRARLMRKISAALGDSYAGAWFDPPAAKFDVGVTSGASARRVRRVAADAGLGASVVETPVRHTWAELIAAQARWHARLSKLLAQGEAQTGLDSPHNAVVVTLSSSVPAAERAALRREAVTDNSANVSVNVSTPAQMGVKKDAVTCTSPFVTEEGYCQPTLVSGVAIRTPEGLCTSGPMLFEGNETYMVTAGHCFGKGSPEGGSAVTGEVTSRYTPTGALLEIGRTGTWYENNERDMAIVRVNRAANNFTQPLPSPVPVPALMAEWEKEPLNPHAVNGVREAAPKLVVCHEGAVTGEKCGEILKLNVEAAGTAHLVEVNACAQTGDSGGPFFRRETGEVMMMGIEVASNQCVEPFKSYFEPMLDLEGSPEKGVLSTFHPKELLTKSNETRTTPTLSAKWLVGGAEVATELSAELEGEFTLVDFKNAARRRRNLMRQHIYGRASRRWGSINQRNVKFSRRSYIINGLIGHGTFVYRRQKLHRTISVGRAPAVDRVTGVRDNRRIDQRTVRSLNQIRRRRESRAVRRMHGVALIR